MQLCFFGIIFVAELLIHELLAWVWIQMQCLNYTAPIQDVCEQKKKNYFKKPDIYHAGELRVSHYNILHIFFWVPFEGHTLFMCVVSKLIPLQRTD